MANSILCYYKPIGLPNPNGSWFLLKLSSRQTQVEAAVARQSICKSRKRGPYRRYTDEERARIAKYAVEHGVVSAARKLSKELKVRFEVLRSRMRKKEQGRGQLVIHALLKNCYCG